MKRLKWRWQDAVKADQELTSTQKLVGFMLSTYADTKTGQRAFPSAKRLARDCSLNERSVRRALAVLRERGYIVDVTPMRMKVQQQARGWSNEYDLVLPPDTVSDPPDRESQSPGQRVSPTDPGTDHSIIQSEKHSAPVPSDPWEQKEFVESHFGHFEPGGEPCTDSMIDRGYHPYAVINTIRSGRCDQ